MPSLLSRIWATSPASLARAVRRRLDKLRAGEEWFTITDGPARGLKILLPVPLAKWSHELIGGTFDAFLHEALNQHRSPAGRTFWDIGANIGYHALALASQGAKVVAFEPGRANVARLNLHLDANPALKPWVKIIGAAVADADGEMTFVESDDMTGANTGSHLATATPPLSSAYYAKFEECKVPAVTMDTLVRQRRESPPDIIKIDVEGAEHLVLQGGRQMLREHKPLLLIEVHHICVMLEVAEILLTIGYQIEVLNRKEATASRCFILAR